MKKILKNKRLQPRRGGATADHRVGTTPTTVHPFFSDCTPVERGENVFVFMLEEVLRASDFVQLIKPIICSYVTDLTHTHAHFQDWFRLNP